ncbi:MerR family transcriptional regulator [Spirosoma rhododendri]|uniref:MerR family transcriptional regulator n=1 Tax=Spirosoma rhododendri TaxID=2728024 RepID=A0A7L5DN64_9BACT|nr:MerR family transcriptional regulator [Spirosoma rhododendri]QJD79899.1 MerR family transcriptional regulator [Spirosoma rhododendri]
MEQPEKMYYGIREVSDMLGVTAPTLRFYEKEFPSLQPRKNKSGDRVYTPTDIALLREILTLTKDKGFTLAGAREELKKREQQRHENARFLGKLRELKSFLEQMRISLDPPDPNKPAEEDEDE